MKRLFTVYLFLLFSFLVSAQPSNPKAENLKREGKLEEAIEAYTLEHTKSPDNWKNTYDLACAYALIYQKDSAFQYLNIALENDNSLWALADSDLLALTEDTRWRDVVKGQFKKYQEVNGNLNQPEYAEKLLELIRIDQAFDYYIDQAKANFMKEGKIPHWYYPIGSYRDLIGGDNFGKLKEMLENYGWPKYSMVGDLAADAPLLLINHHESDSVRVKYLPQIRKACFEKEGSCMEFAKIQDRILVNSDQKQIYGMQFRYNDKRELEPFPVKDPEYVDQRRKEIGLEPLKDYLKRKIDYDWTVEQK